MKTNLFFVYGTLRVNQSNWRWALRDKTGVKHLGLARTRDKFALYSSGIPFVFKAPAVTRIMGDVFEVTNPNVIKNLDQLEGHQSGVMSGYHRETIPVIMENDMELTAWIYFYYLDQPHGRLIDSGDWLETEDAGLKFRREP